MKKCPYLAMFFLIALFACDKDEDNQLKTDPPLSMQERVISLLGSYETGDSTKAVEYINPNNFVQHNLHIADGLEGMVKAISDGILKGTKIVPLRVLIDDDLIITHGEYQMNNISMVGFNIFRFKNDKIVEHWDNLQLAAGPNPSGHSMTDGAIDIMDESKTQANKDLIRNFTNEILIAGQDSLVSDFFNGNDLIQHNPTMKDSVSSWQAALENLSEQGTELIYHQLQKVVAQGNFVLAISDGQMGGQPMAFYDLYRLENDKIVEHWDVTEEIPDESTWSHNNGKF